MKFTPDYIRYISPQAEQFVGGRWVPARPMNLDSFLVKLEHAWGVLTGRYDVLDWEY